MLRINENLLSSQIVVRLAAPVMLTCAEDVQVPRIVRVDEFVKMGFAGDVIVKSVVGPGSSGALRSLVVGGVVGLAPPQPLRIIPKLNKKSPNRSESMSCSLRFCCLKAVFILSRQDTENYMGG